MYKRQNNHAVLIDMVGLSLLCVSMVLFSWVGHLCSDDMHYINAALSWAQSFPYVGDSHLTLRHTVTIPVAVSFGLFGVNEFTSILPSTLCYIALVLISYLIVRYIAGRRAGLLSALLISTTPLISVSGTIHNADVTEGLFIFLSLSTLYIAIRRKQTTWLLIFTGIFMALAWYNRLTSIGLCLFYLLLFLKGWGGRRSRYVYVILVFLLFIAVEALFYWVITGDPVYRINTTRQSHWAPLGLFAPGTGNIVAEAVGIHALEPFLTLLFNQEFALIFWISIPVTIFGLRWKSSHNFQKDYFLYMLGISIVWFLFISYIAPVRLLPRYYYVLVVATCIAISLFISNLYVEKRYLSIGIMTIIILFNLLGVYVENKAPLFGERNLIKILKEYDDPINTDPITAHRAKFLLRLAEKSVTTFSVQSLPEGSLYFYNPNNFQQAIKPVEFSMEYKPVSSWKKLEEIGQNRKWIGLFIENLGIKPYIPPCIYKKLNYPNDPVCLFQVAKR